MTRSTCVRAFTSRMRSLALSMPPWEKNLPSSETTPAPAGAASHPTRSAGNNIQRTEWHMPSPPKGSVVGSAPTSPFVGRPALFGPFLGRLPLAHVDLQPRPHELHRLGEPLVELLLPEGLQELL